MEKVMAFSFGLFLAFSAGLFVVNSAGPQHSHCLHRADSAIVRRCQRRVKKPNGDANIFLRLLSLDPDKGKKPAGFPLCSEASW
jgi:hypothetical protein